MRLWANDVGMADAVDRGYQGLMNAVEPRLGDMYRIDHAFEALVMTHFAAPFTGGGKCILPAGLTFVVAQMPIETATGFYADPVERDAWENKLVPEQDCSADRYTGYSLVISKLDLSSHCSPAR